MPPEPNLRVTEIKAFVPAKDFALSKRFYQEIGFTMASEGGGVAYFRCGSASFLLQDFWVEGCADNFIPWRMRDFCLIDPTGVLWRIGQNVN